MKSIFNFLKGFLNLWVVMNRAGGRLGCGILAAFSLAAFYINFQYVRYYRNLANQMGVAICELDDLHRKEYHNRFMCMILGIIASFITIYSFLTFFGLPY